MKKIGELDKPLKALSPRDIQTKTVPTLRDILSESVGRKKPDSAKQSRGLFKLTDKILEAKGFVELGDLEFDTVKDAVNENPAGYFPYYHGQVVDMLEMIK